MKLHNFTAFQRKIIYQDCGEKKTPTFNHLSYIFSEFFSARVRLKPFPDHVIRAQREYVCALRWSHHRSLRSGILDLGIMLTIKASIYFQERRLPLCPPVMTSLAQVFLTTTLFSTSFTLLGTIINTRSSVSSPKLHRFLFSL